MAQEAREEAGLQDGRPTGFLMESPEDPMTYMPEGEADELPSFWNWPELQGVAQDYGWFWTSLDQGRLGHCKKKPTTLLHNVPELHEALNELRGGPGGKKLPITPEESIQESKTWARWADGLVEMLKHTLNPYLATMVQERDAQPREGGSSDGSEESGCGSLKKMNVEKWRQHVECGHVPYRRDCGVCVENMGCDAPHRRRPRGLSAFVMAVDLVGPFKSGKDLGVDQTAKYMMLATVPVPYEMDKKVTDSEEKPVEEAQEWGEGDGSGELEDLVGDRDEAEEGPVLEVEEDEPSEKVSEEDAKKVNAEWKKIAEELSEPYMVQNLTLGEPLQSRSVDEILSGMAKLLSKYKAMGVPVIRIHSDREKAMVSGRVRNWIAGQGVLQTMTGGDDGPGNGRIEAEVNQFKRRLRLSLSTTGWGETMWPQVARYEVEKRLRSQLEKMGIPQRPMPPIGASVVVKRKRWHRDSPLATPFRTMQLLCPSPMMTSGWLVRDGDQVVHARVALLPDHQADVAIKQWAETDPENPRRRLRGKQPVQVPDVVLPEGYPVRPPLEEGPSLHVLHAKAGGGSHGALKGQQCELSQSQDQVDQPHGVPELHEVTGEDLCVCQGCGVHQMKAYKVCKMCEEPLKVEASSEEDGVLWEEEPVSVEDLAREHDELRQVHWRWRMEMTNGLKHMPLGEDEGKLQGCWMKFLQLQLLQTEQDLCEQVDWLEGHEVRTALRLASMKDQGSGDVGQEDEVPVVLQTYTVPLATVKKELDLWKPSFKQELHQLFEETKALRRTTDAQLAKEVDMDTVDYAPSKLVPTVKAPLGRRKARICICGNLLQADQNGKNPENYAGGADSLTLRIALRQAALRSWSVATCDVRTAFLWAPRRKSSRTITTRPPKVVIQAGLATEDEVWIVDHALYGLASSPADWGMHRDDRLAEVKWTSPEGGERWLERTTEANVWRIGQKLPNSFTETETIGDLLTHVDDLLIMADSATGKEVLTQVEALWTVSTPEWVSEDSWVKFCGLELKWRGESLMVSQASYTKELLTRYDGILEKDVPLPRLDGELEPEHDASWQDVRLAQTLVGEVLWLSARARADISYATAYMGARTIKNPKHVVRVGRHLLGYLKSTATWCLEYGPKDDNVVELEVESDASFAPRGERSHQGLLALWHGGLGVQEAALRDAEYVGVGTAGLRG